jgi:uncharacterized protein YnzC (UPF0291/DUF896 family)
VKINSHIAYKKTCSLTIAEMPQYFVTSATESGKEDVLHYVDEVNQEISRATILEKFRKQLQNENWKIISLFF